jgi:hypothetical protein
MTFASLKRSIRRLYEGATPSGVRFRYALLAFDMVTVLFIIATSFLHSTDNRNVRRSVRHLDTCRFFSTTARQPASAARFHPVLNLD